MDILARNVESVVLERLEISPIVVISGARQVGKSTLAAKLSGDSALYVTMDDELTRSFALDDPTAFLSQAGAGRLVIDEIQRCPGIILPLKAEVDRDRRPGRFILTGSANLLRVPGAEDSLAGRAMNVRLHPFSQGEVEGRTEDWVTRVLNRQDMTAQSDRNNVINRICKGGYPPVQDFSDRLRTSWLRDYADRLLERDSQEFGSARVPELKKLLHILAAEPGSELVLEKLANHIGVARSTVGRYVDLLESLFLIYRLPSWSRNLTTRQVKRPKCYLTDPAVAAALTKQSADHLSSIRGSDHLGGLMENFVVCELLRQQAWSATDYSLSYYRDSNGGEVDLIIETPQGVIAVEIKAAAAATQRHFKNLITLRQKLGEEFIAGIVITTAQGATVGDRLHAIPVTNLWQ